MSMVKLASQVCLLQVKQLSCSVTSPEDGTDIFSRLLDRLTLADLRCTCRYSAEQSHPKVTPFSACRASGWLLVMGW